MLIDKLKEDAIRATVYGFIIIMLIVGATKLLGNTQEQSLKVQKAIGCELGVPAIDGVRDPALLRGCWTVNGLEPPVFLNE